MVTDRWQKFTKQRLGEPLLEEFAAFCDEFLIHAVDVEGKSAGIDRDLTAIIGSWGGIPVTYAGGVKSFHDLELLYEASKGKLDVAIGSALDLFGGPLKYEKVVEYCSSK